MAKITFTRPPLSLLLIAASAGSAFMALWIGTHEHWSNWGAPSTWGAIAAGAIGSSVALQSLRHAQSATATAERSRRIDQIIEERRRAIATAGDYLGCALGIKAYLVDVEAAFEGLRVVDGVTGQRSREWSPQNRLTYATDTPSAERAMPPIDQIETATAAVRSYVDTEMTAQYIRALGATQNTVLALHVNTINTLIQGMVGHLKDLLNRARAADPHYHPPLFALEKVQREITGSIDRVKVAIASPDLAMDPDLVEDQLISGREPGDSAWFAFISRSMVRAQARDATGIGPNG